MCIDDVFTSKFRWHLEKLQYYENDQLDDEMWLNHISPYCFKTCLLVCDGNCWNINFILRFVLKTLSSIWSDEKRAVEECSRKQSQKSYRQRIGRLVYSWDICLNGDSDFFYIHWINCFKVSSLSPIQLNNPADDHSMIESRVEVLELQFFLQFFIFY